MKTRGGKRNGRKLKSRSDPEEHADHSLVDIPYYDWHKESEAYTLTDDMRSAIENDKMKSKHDDMRSAIENDKMKSKQDDMRSAIENDKMKSKQDLRTVSRSPIKNDANVGDYTRSLKSVSECDGGQSYDSRWSPIRDDWKQITNHHSPKDDWLKSHRSRSRSWSPAHGTRRHSGFIERNKSTICKDFASGRCSRGDFCSFLHEGDPSYEDNRSRKGRDSWDWSKHDCRGSERRDRGGFRRTFDIPCRFFGFGTCRYGKHCRFSHHVEERINPERSLRDERREWNQNSNDVEKSCNGPKWRDVSVVETAKLGTKKEE